MSSRALRKAQQRAEEERLAALALKEAQKNDDSDDEEEEEEEAPVVSKKPNLFAMLEAELEEAEPEDDGDDDDDGDTPKPTSTSTSAASKKKKQNKKKKKKKNKGKGKDTGEGEENEEDDFDSALQALKSTTLSPTNPATTTSQPPSVLLNSLLHIDPRHLDLENEMRKLFGRSAARENPQDTRTARSRIPGTTIRPLSSRRNPFVQPADNWPRDSSGGLSMDLLSKSQDDGTVSFRYSHSRAYQETQRQFLLCVRSMDPDRMISHLSSHPYHISTLLQTSHIALTQSNDHTTSQTLLSRALFSMGRSSHSVFPTSLTSGLARLSFEFFENRELYFAAWKYVLSLSRRGLWRTGLEFIRLLLQLSPLEDPLCLNLIIDQYALKSRCFDTLLSLSSTPLLSPTWSTSPNIAYSLSLAEFMAGNLDAAKSRLKDAIKTYPWLMTKLHGALSAENTAGKSLPEELWGLLPPSETDNLLAEMYTLRMGDLWNIPEHAQFLTSTLYDAKKFDINKGDIKSMKSVYEGAKMRNLARHVFLMDLSEGRGLIGFLPLDVRSDQGYAWDILPPVGNESAYQREMEVEGAGATTAGGGPMEAVGARGLFEAFFRSLMPDFQAPPPGATTANPTQPQPQPQPQQTGAAVPIAGAGTGVGNGTFEVGEDDLRATLVTMIEDGVGFPPEMPIGERAEVALEVGLVPRELLEWYGQRFGIIEVWRPSGQDSEEEDEEEEVEIEAEAAEEEEEEEEVQERDSRAIDRLVQILGTGDRASLRMRVDRMFEGQGADMAEVKRRVEERLGLR